MNRSVRSSSLAAPARELIGRTRPKGRGRRPGEAVEFLVAGPPKYGSPEQWSEDREALWARESFEWIRRTIGSGSLVVAAALHRDETSPHLHCLVVPVHDGKLGWTAVRNAAVDRVKPSLPSPARTRYAALQDSYQLDVGCRFGLARGERGSQATHAQVDRSRAVQTASAIAIDLHDRSVERAEKRREADEAAARERHAQLELERAEIERERAQVDDRAAAALATAARLEAVRDAAHEAESGAVAEVLRMHVEAEKLDRAAASAIRMRRDATAEREAVERQLAELRAEAEVAERERAESGAQARSARAEAERERERELLARTRANRESLQRSSESLGKHVTELARETERIRASRDEALAEREAARRRLVTAATAADRVEHFGTAGFAGEVLRIAAALGAELPKPLAGALRAVVEKRSPLPLMRLAGKLFGKGKGR